jgi:hypothetical protein
MIPLGTTDTEARIGHAQKMCIFGTAAGGFGTEGPGRCRDRRSRPPEGEKGGNGSRLPQGGGGHQLLTRASMVYIIYTFLPQSLFAPALGPLALWLGGEGDYSPITATNITIATGTT